MSEKDDMKSGIKPWQGFAHVLCPWCGAEDSFCLRQPTTTLTCKVCRNAMDLPRATRAYINCECGFNGKYSTNRVDDMFEIPCIKCGSPNPVSYHHGKQSYLPVGWLPKYRRGKRKNHGK